MDSFLVIVLFTPVPAELRASKSSGQLRRAVLDAGRARARIERVVNVE